MASEAAEQSAQILAAALAKECQQGLQLIGWKGRGRVESRVVAILPRQNGEGDALLARHLSECFDAVAPPIEPAEQPDHDDPGVLPDLVDPEVDGHRVTQVAQMRKPHARQRVLLNRERCGEPGKVAVGERQHHDVAR